MPTWKMIIFMNAITSRMKLEGRKAEEIIEDYPRLTDEERAEILASI